MSGYAINNNEATVKELTNCIILGDVTGTTGMQGWSVYGTATLKTDTTIPSGKALQIPNSATLNIAQDITLINNGEINNQGTISNAGTVDNRNGKLELSRKAHTQVAGKICAIGFVGNNRNGCVPFRPNYREYEAGFTVMASEVGRAAVERSLSRQLLPAPCVALI